jgi:hypothetical protein
MLRFDYFGTALGIERCDGRWLAYRLGDDGKRRPASDIVIPAWVGEDDLADFLSDLGHESATPQRPLARRLD